MQTNRSAFSAAKLTPFILLAGASQRRMEEEKVSGRSGDPGARPCRCGNIIAGLDTHQSCASCLGLDHARLALDVPGSCQHCLAFTRKSLRRRLARQVSLTGHDPYLPTDSHSAGTLLAQISSINLKFLWKLVAQTIVKLCN